MRLLRDVERSLAEMPIPRLQRPFEPFLYDFDWPWYGDGGWSVRKYEARVAEVPVRRFGSCPGSLRP